MLSLTAATTVGRSAGVDLTGVVTAAETDWDGKFFLQDASGGVFVSRSGPRPAVGDIVRVQGYAGPGAFAPIVHAERVDRIGPGELPPARAIPIERIMSGAEDSQRVEITGQVRAIHFDAIGKLLVDVAVGAYRVRVIPQPSPEINRQSLIGARVTARGTATTSFNAALRQLTAVNLFVPRPADFVIRQRETSPPPFERPTVALADVARYHTSASLTDRRHVRGVVTFQRLGQDLYLQDESGGLLLQSLQATRVPLGQPVEAVGFLEFVDYQPVLADAVFRTLPGRPIPQPPRKASWADLNDGRYRGELITLTGRLLNRSISPVRRPEAHFSGRRILLTLQSGKSTFTAEGEEETAEGPSNHAALPLGGLLRVTGVASFVTGDDGRPQALKLLLPAADSAVLLEAPSWFTTERLIFCLAGVCLVLACVAGWTFTLDRRVQERTAQLKFEMTARRAAEVEFRAVLSERTRLARELHDTLEQALTGIALQLDTASRLFPRAPDDAAARLELARGFLRQSQLELRRSIWDLRSRELERFDLAEALANAGRQIAAASGLRVDMETVGELKRLPEVVEENLLRIGQEALTNVVKHSGATRVTIRLEIEEAAAALQIKDNGNGLGPEPWTGPAERHYGLLGMSERAKRIGGRFDVNGPPGEGTTVRVSLDLRQEEVAG